MRILHTSDWHLGKKLDSVSRLNEQEGVMNEICEISYANSVDLVVVAGDIFDTFNPSVEAIELLYATLIKLSRNGQCPVVVIAGNHDSPDRIEAPNPLAQLHGILFFGQAKSELQGSCKDLPFEVLDSEPCFIELGLLNKEKVRIVVAPFANEHRLFEMFSGNKDLQITETLSAFWNAIAQSKCDSQGVNIFVGHHLFLSNFTDAIQEPDGEKPIQAISALFPLSAIPEQIQYVALGHLHRYQTIQKKPAVVYSGSPLAYSFSEANQKKYVVIVDVQASQEPIITPIVLQNGIPLLKKTVNSVEEALIWLQKNQNCYVELTIQITEYLSPQELRALHQAHTKIISIIPQLLVAEISKDQQLESIKPELDMEQHFCEYFKQKHAGVEPNEELKMLFKRILAE